MLSREPFGRTGHHSTRAIFGAVALAQVTQAEADRTLALLLDAGVNHIDTAASYGDAELRLAPWLAAHRGEVFLATKTEARTYEGAWAELQRSRQRMGVDYVDLWQMHLLVDPAEWETAMGPGGALEAFVAAREQGLARFLGVTGHGVAAARMHRRSLDRFDFDAVLLPYNYAMMQNPAYAADFEALLETCRARQVAVQTIKGVARGPWGDRTPNRATWYAPLEDPAEIEAAVHWVLSRPGLFLNTVGDMDLLPLVLAAAARFDPAVPQAVPARRLSRAALTPLFV